MTGFRKSAILLAAALCIAACSASGPRLNSERIEGTFGSFGIDVLAADAGRRISSLYSGRGDDRTTRTYAVVEFLDARGQAFRREHELIAGGGSIGATFSNAGWEIRKQHLFIGEFEVPPSYAKIAKLMRIELPETLATHQYLFEVSKDERSWNYARITEVHHPDFLDAGDLRDIYGEILFDDSNRDSIHDFIGPPALK